MPSVQTNHRAVFADAETKMSSETLEYQDNAAATPRPLSNREAAPELRPFDGDQNAAKVDASGQVPVLSNVANAPHHPSASRIMNADGDHNAS